MEEKVDLEFVAKLEVMKLMREEAVRRAQCHDALVEALEGLMEYEEDLAALAAEHGSDMLPEDMANFDKARAALKLARGEK